VSWLHHLSYMDLGVATSHTFSEFLVGTPGLIRPMSDCWLASGCMRLLDGTSSPALADRLGWSSPLPAHVLASQLVELGRLHPMVSPPPFIPLPPNFSSSSCVFLPVCPTSLNVCCPTCVLSILILLLVCLHPRCCLLCQSPILALCLCMWCCTFLPG
jgi:hypothetical protein